MTNITVENFIESFPHPIIPKQIGEPNYEKMQEVHYLASASMSSVETVGDTSTSCTQNFFSP